MNALAILGVIGGACAALIGIGVVARGVWKMTRRIVHISDAVRELVPNGGNSIKDQITRIERRVAAVEKAVGVEHS